MEENQQRKILQDYYQDLSEANIRNYAEHRNTHSLIEDRALVFSQFLFSFAATLLAIFFSVESFNKLIMNNIIYNWAIIFYLFSLVVFIFSIKEKNDTHSMDLEKIKIRDKDYYNKGFSILNKQFVEGINIDIFYRDIEKLNDESEEDRIKMEKDALKNPADYSLELYLFLILVSFWLLFFSTQNSHIFYLYAVIPFIFFLTNNQDKYFYELVRWYSRFVIKVFPPK